MCRCFLSIFITYRYVCIQVICTIEQTLEERRHLMSAKHEFSTATFWPERERVCDTYSVNYLDVHGAKEYNKTIKKQ